MTGLMQHLASHAVDAQHLDVLARTPGPGVLVAARRTPSKVHPEHGPRRLRRSFTVCVQRSRQVRDDAGSVLLACTSMSGTVYLIG